MGLSKSVFKADPIRPAYLHSEGVVDLVVDLCEKELLLRLRLRTHHHHIVVAAVDEHVLGEALVIIHNELLLQEQQAGVVASYYLRGMVLQISGFCLKITVFPTKYCEIYSI